MGTSYWRNVLQDDHSSRRAPDTSAPFILPSLHGLRDRNAQSRELGWKQMLDLLQRSDEAGRPLSPTPPHVMRDRLENNMDATQTTHPLAACTALPGPLDWRFLPACAEHVSRAAKGATDARGHYCECERNHSTSPLPLLHAAKQPGRRRESLAPSSSLPEPCGQETVEGKRAGRRHMIDPSISHQATPPFPLFSCSLPCRSCVRRSASVSHRILLLQSSKNWYRLKSNDMFLFSPV